MLNPSGIPALTQNADSNMLIRIQIHKAVFYSLESTFTDVKGRQGKLVCGWSFQLTRKTPTFPEHSLRTAVDWRVLGIRKEQDSLRRRNSA